MHDTMDQQRQRMSSSTHCWSITSALLVPLFLFQATDVFGLIPATPREQTQRAIASLRNVIDNHDNQKPLRLFVDYLIPLPPETVAADIDPWPGGLAQMYPYAEDILKEILTGIVEDPGGCTSQVISPQDCCGFLVQESNVGPAKDVAAVLFPSVDQLDQISEIDNMVGKDRTLLLFNKQFQRPADFGFLGKQKSCETIFDKFQWGFAFQEFACRGEDVKLTYEYPKGWQSCVICEEDDGATTREVKLLDPTPERPLYEDLEKCINNVLPEPLWMRKMGEVETKGFKFQRGQKE